jgi:hypothetical protein
MVQLLRDYTFLVFSVICAIAVVVIIKKVNIHILCKIAILFLYVASIWQSFIKVPETKGRSVDEIMAQFDNTAAQQQEDASGKLMANTNV